MAASSKRAPGNCSLTQRCVPAAGVRWLDSALGWSSSHIEQLAAPAGEVLVPEALLQQQQGFKEQHQHLPCLEEVEEEAETEELTPVCSFVSPFLAAAGSGAMLPAAWGYMMLLTATCCTWKPPSVASSAPASTSCMAAQDSHVRAAALSCHVLQCPGMCCNVPATVMRPVADVGMLGCVPAGSSLEDDDFRQGSSHSQQLAAAAANRSLPPSAGGHPQQQGPGQRQQQQQHQHHQQQQAGTIESMLSDSMLSMRPAAATPVSIPAAQGVRGSAAANPLARHSFEHGGGSSFAGGASCFGGSSFTDDSPFQQAHLASLDSVAPQQPSGLQSVTSDCGMLRPIHSRHQGAKLPSGYPAAGRQTPDWAAAADRAVPGAARQAPPSFPVSGSAAANPLVRHSFEHGGGSSFAGGASCFGGSSLTDASPFGQPDTDASPFEQPDIDASPFGQAFAEASPFEQPDIDASPFGQAFTEAGPFEQPHFTSLHSVALQQPAAGLLLSVASDCGKLRPVHSRHCSAKLPSSYPAAGRQTPDVGAADFAAGHTQAQETPAGDLVEEVAGIAREEPMVADLPM
jgi:hypothetical protein